MNKIKCDLLCHTNTPHLQQLYTGFSLLSKTGLIDLKQVTHKKKYTSKTRKQHLLVILNNNIKILYDTSDGSGIDDIILQDVDLYFKRSFVPVSDQEYNQMGNKIKPLGLNYLVYPDSVDFTGFKRSILFGDYGLATQLLHLRKSYYPRLNLMHSAPKIDTDPRVLFMVRAWDPFDRPGRSDKEIEDRISINKSRAQCIQYLREEFGNKFLGGFNRTDTTIKYFNKYIISDNNLTSKNKYIMTLGNYPICISTTGLHGSIGWKFGEYVAFSKAILSEQLNATLPGDFSNNKNYLEFASPEDCVEKALILFNSSDLRAEIMINNYEYYINNVSPDALVINTINQALAQ